MNFKDYGLVILCSVSAAALATEQRSEIEFDAMPEAVRNTVSRFIDQNTITRIQEVTDDGYVSFEIKSTKTVGDKEFVATDMTVATDGEIMRLAKEAPAFAIPFPVMKRVNQQYPGLKVDEVEIVQTRYFILKGKADGRTVNLKIYDDGAVHEISNAPKQAQPVQPIAPSEPTLPSPPDTGYQRVMPDQGEAKLPIDRSDYNFDPNSDD